mmetsp:Transcript_19541/g.40275  ORF Transcript_19541/g.40275 Transcript_19541/m.40275 type:complete len:338 (+) Transcript_19541:377-1390(+)
MEEALLQEMIRDREIAIEFLEKGIAFQDDRARRMKTRKEEFMQQKQKEHEEHRAELMQLWRDYDGLLCRYQEAKDELDAKRQQQLEQHQQQQQAADNSNNNNDDEGEAPQPVGLNILTYNEIMKSVVESGGVSSTEDGSSSTTTSSSTYVIRMQSQLCKAMHGMGIMETQRQLTKRQMEHILKKAKDVITEMVEQQSEVELQMVNELIVTDTSKREVDAKKTKQHKDFSKQKNDLMDKIERQFEEQAKNGNDDAGSAENDEEEEAAKEEIKEILQEGNAEMERLSKLNKEAEEKIEALKIKAAMAQGQDVVHDIVTSIAEEFAMDESGDEDSDGGSY